MPSANLPSVDPPIVLVPLICFNPLSKQRIGYGGGYYDRFIEHARKVHKQMAFIGIGAECLKAEDVFWNEQDQALDYIVTESRIY